MKLLCKLVTNPLKPTTNGMCSPYKFVLQLGLGALWPRTTALDAAGALTRVSNKVPFLWVALSWRLSLFPLGDSDIGRNIAHIPLAKENQVPKTVIIMDMRGRGVNACWPIIQSTTSLSYFFIDVCFYFGFNFCFMVTCSKHYVKKHW